MKHKSPLLFLIAVLFLGGCVSGPGPRQVLSESLTAGDKSTIINAVIKHDYKRVPEIKWTNPDTGNHYQIYPRWRNKHHYIFALHAVVNGRSTVGGQLIQGYGHVIWQNDKTWIVSPEFSDIQMLRGQGKRKRNYRRRHRFYFNMTN